MDKLERRWTICRDRPCDRVLPVLGPQNNIVTHRLALPDKDVAAAIATARASASAAPAIKLAFEFLALTAAQFGEAPRAWHELDTASQCHLVLELLQTPRRQRSDRLVIQTEAAPI